MERIAIYGCMGSGKSTVGRLLAQRLSLPFIDLDGRIESLHGRTIAQIFSDDGEPVFRQYERDALADLQSGDERWVVALGGGALQSQSSIDSLRATAVLVVLEASVDSMVRRLDADAQRGVRPLLQTGDLAERLGGLLASRAQWYGQGDLCVRTDERTPDDVVDEITAWLRRSGEPEAE